MIPGAEKRGIDFTDLMMWLAVASKHVRLMVLLVCFSLLCGLDYFIYARPLYSSRALISYREIPTAVDTQKIYGQERATRLTLLPQLTSPNIVTRAEAKLGNVPNRTGIKKEVIRAVKAEFNDEGNIELAVFTYNPEWTRTFPEMLVKEFLDQREELRLAYREEVIKKTSSELEKINEKIKADFKQIERFKDTNALSAIVLDLDQLKEVPRQRWMTKQRIADMNEARLKLQDQSLGVLARLAILSALEYDLKVGQTIQNFESGGGGYGVNTNRVRSGPVVIGPSLVQGVQQDQQWRELERKKFGLDQEIYENGKFFLPKHPKMLALNRSLDTVTRSLEAELAAMKFRFDLNYQDQMNKARDLDQKFELWQNLGKRNDTLQAELNLIKESQVKWDVTSADATKRLRELDFSADKERVQLRFMALIQLRDVVPVSPNRLKLVLYSLAMGIALAIGVPFLLEFLDQTASNVEKIEQIIQVRGLGIVPKFDETMSDPYPVISPDGGGGGNLLEAFRVIRTNLMSSAAISKAPQVIMVTSAMPKEGKTVVMSNMAMSFAQMGERTLIIDCNLRRGLAHHPFRCRSTPGLSNILIDRISVEETIRPTDFENLSILPCGEHLEGDIEQLGSPGFAKLIDRLRQKYHRIIIDTPPVLGLSETSVMQGVVDGVVFVIWSNQTPLRSVKTAVDLLHANHANFYGFVLNRLDLQATMNRFHYYYYSNHYYNRYQALEKVS